MTTFTPLLKRVYDVVALFALFNLLGLAGLVGLLVLGGALDRSKARRIIAVLREEESADVGRRTDGAVKSAGQDSGDARPTAADHALAIDSEADLAALRREAERIKAELDQRLALNNRILLRVTEAREQFRKEREEAEREREAAAEQRREEGFRKQIAIYEALAPKIAVRHLLAVSDPDQAARILLEIDTRKAKKIVEAAKRGDQLERMKVILRRVREVAPHRYGEFESEGTES